MNGQTAHRIRSEIEVTTSRSSGPGGQNVNKVETKVTLRFDVRASVNLSEGEKEILLEKLKNQLTTEGVLIVGAEAHRSQLKNKELAFRKFEQLIAKAFYKPKARKATKPSKSAALKRLQKKKEHSEKKKWRQKGPI